MIRSDASRRPRRSRRTRRDRGAAAVEMALVMPMLLLVLFGIIDFGRMLNAQITLTQATREGARAAAYGQANAAVTQRVRDAASGLDAAELTVPTVTVCTAGGSATVKTQYTFEFVTPVSVFAGMFGATPQGTYDLTATGVVTCPS